MLATFTTGVTRPAALSAEGGNTLQGTLGLCRVTTHSSDPVEATRGVRLRSTEGAQGRRGVRL